jgi:superkiller protein 3
MKKIVFLILFVGMGATTLHAQKKTFVRDYTYQAGEADSKLTARANATTQMRNILLSEVGQYLHVERTLKQDDTSEEFSQKIEAITAGIVEMKTLDERWDGVTYYIKAEMTVDPKDLERRIAEVLNDKQKTKELEEARKRTLAAEAEAARLRKELETTKDEPLRLDLQKTYPKAADVLSAEEYATKGSNAYENGFNELAIEYLQKAIDLDPNYAWAHAVLGASYLHLEDYNTAIRCYQKAIDLDPDYAWAYAGLGGAYYLLDDYNKAIRYFQKAIDLDPNNAAAYYYVMGMAYYYWENYREAIRCYQKVIALDPNDAAAYYNMGRSYYLSGNKKEGIKDLQQAARLGHSKAQDDLRVIGKKW